MRSDRRFLIMPTFESLDTKWLAGFKTLHKQVREASDRQSRQDAVGRTWTLLTSAIAMYCRMHGGRLGRVSPQDIEDIAAEKSSDLVRKLEQGTWDVADRSHAEIAAFVSRTARNGLVDRLRVNGRRVEFPQAHQSNGRQGEHNPEIPASTMNQDEPADSLVERREYAAALRDCAEQLDEQSRRVWFLRVLCDMRSKNIATHPQVSLGVNHVDVLLYRSRRAIRDCMDAKGYEPGDMPPGTFIELWTSCGFDELKASIGADS